MNKELIKQGFVKRASNYGIDPTKAGWLFKQADAGLAGSLGNAAGDYFGGAGVTNGVGIGGLVGGAIGGINGLMNDTPDENGETHRMWNGLKGLGTGAGIGAGVGGAAGYAAGVLPNLDKLKDAMKIGFGAPPGVGITRMPQFTMTPPPAPAQ